MDDWDIDNEDLDELLPVGSSLSLCILPVQVTDTEKVFFITIVF